MRKRLVRAEYQSEPYLAWNAYVNILASGDYKDLSPIQRIAHLAFWYDAEVQNGGHLQYFENRRGKYLRETLKALITLGAESQHAVLTRAIARRKRLPFEIIRTVAEFVRAGRRGDYEEDDRAYYACRPELVTELLEEYLQKHFSEFIILV